MLISLARRVSVVDEIRIYFLDWENLIFLEHLHYDKTTSFTGWQESWLTRGGDETYIEEDPERFSYQSDSYL